MRLWMDVMRHLEPVVEDHQRLFDAWEAGGVDGIVVGPLAFADKSYTFDPNPEVYARFGLEPPRPDGTSLWWRAPVHLPGHSLRRSTAGPREQGTTPDREAVLQRRAALEQTLERAKERGWQVWLFCPHYGAPPTPGPILTDDATRTAVAARMVDAMEHYPMADGALMDGPEWGYEIAPFHQRGRSSIFHDLPPRWPKGPSAWATPTPASSRPRDRLSERLHRLSDREVRLWGSGAGGFLGAFGLLGNDPGLAEWLAFRMDALTETYARVREIAQGRARRPIRVAAGPRSAAFSGALRVRLRPPRRLPRPRPAQALLLAPRLRRDVRHRRPLRADAVRVERRPQRAGGPAGGQGPVRDRAPGDRHPERLRPRVPPGVLRPGGGAGDGAGPGRVRRPGAGLPLGGRRA